MKQGPSTFKGQGRGGKRSFVGRAMLKVKYTKDMKSALAHIRYIAFRSRELGEQTKGIFNEKDNYASVSEFQQKLSNDRTIRHPNRVKLHKLVISYKQEWYDKYGIDYKDLTRHIMKYIEEKKGIKLDWVAAQHLNSGHPHVHIAIKSSGQDSFSLKTKHLKLTKEDYKDIREELDRYTGRDRFVQQDRDMNKEFEMNHPVNSVISEICKEIDKQVKTQERQGEHLTEKEKRKQQRDSDRNER